MTVILKREDPGSLGDDDVTHHTGRCSQRFRLLDSNDRNVGFSFSFDIPKSFHDHGTYIGYNLGIITGA